MKTSISANARERMLEELFEPLFLAEWADAVFLHYAVKPEVLQPFVPFPLDLHEGMAYVSFVAFTMRHLRPSHGGKWTAWPLKPIATHEFLNLRTYVTHKGEPGIYFLAEWLPNKLSVLLGPAVFGLPYRRASASYCHDPVPGLTGCVTDTASGCALRYSAQPVVPETLDTAESGSLTEFLLERYTAFTSFLGLHRRFRVWHPAWRHMAVNATIHENSLSARTGDWHCAARFIGAHYAPGFKDIWMGRPRLA